MTLLAADGLSVGAADGSTLLSNASLEIERGETLLLCGPPGSGKTILAKALKGLLDDRDDLELEGRVRREGSVGFVFQSPRTQLVRRTVERDVAFALENRGLPVEEIEARVARVADALDATHLLDRTVRELSGGEATTVAILGVLVTEPDLLLLDEPLASLDRRNTALVIDAIDRLRERETAVVIAEHDCRDLLARCDRTVLLDDGRIRRDAPPRAAVRDLFDAGVKLPFATEVAVEVDPDDAAIPLSTTDPGAEHP